MVDRADGDMEGEPLRQYEETLGHVRGRLAREALLLLINEARASGTPTHLPSKNKPGKGK